MTTSHADRIRAAAAAFKAANHSLISALEALEEEAAGRAPSGGGWSAAQIGWHVAETNTMTAGMLIGEVPGPKAAPGFTEDAAVFSRIPAKVDTFPTLKPPTGVTRQEAITRLRASEAPTVLAIESLTPDRASGYTVRFPFGDISLYQFAEFVGAHVGRHQQQLVRCIAAV